MKRIPLWFFVILLLGYSACNKTPEAPAENDVLVIPVEVRRIECVNVFTIPHEFVAQSREELDQIFNHVQTTLPCYPLEDLRSTDFEQYALLGKVITGSGCCPPEVDSRLEGDAGTGKYTLNLTVTERGVCEVFFSWLQVYVVPAISDRITLRVVERRRFKGTCP